MVAAGDVIFAADGGIRPGRDSIALKFTGAAVVDEGWVDGYGENTILRLDPALVGGDGQFPGAGGLLREGIRNGVAFYAGVVKHVGCREIVDDLLAVQKKNRAVVLQSRRQALQVQIEVKGVAVALPVQDDAFLDVVAENFILEIHIGEHILIQHLGADAGGCRLTGEALLLGFGGGTVGLHGNSLLVRGVGDLRGCSVEFFGGDGRLRRKRVPEEHAYSAVTGRGGEQEAIRKIDGKILFMRTVDAFVSANGRSTVCILQRKRVVDILPVAVVIRVMNGRTILHGSVASVRQTEPFAGLGAFLVYFADDVAVRITVVHGYCVRSDGICGWQQLNEHCYRQRHREKFG